MSFYKWFDCSAIIILDLSSSKHFDVALIVFVFMVNIAFQSKSYLHISLLQVDLLRVVDKRCSTNRWIWSLVEHVQLYKGVN